MKVTAKDYNDMIKKEIVIYNPTVTKLQSEITRAEFIRWYWINVSTYENPELIYLQGRERSIEESIEAGNQFNEWLSEYKATQSSDAAKEN